MSKMQGLNHGGVNLSIMYELEGLCRTISALLLQSATCKQTDFSCSSSSDVLF